MPTLRSWDFLAKRRFALRGCGPGHLTQSVRLQATCVALASKNSIGSATRASRVIGKGVLIVGAHDTGKSRLARGLIKRGAWLVGDDMVECAWLGSVRCVGLRVRRQNYSRTAELFASPVARTLGHLMVRKGGGFTYSHLAACHVVLVVWIDGIGERCRRFGRSLVLRANPRMLRVKPEANQGQDLYLLPRLPVMRVSGPSWFVAGRVLKVLDDC